MSRRKEILAVVLIVLPWTLLITTWHQNNIPFLFSTEKDPRSSLESLLGSCPDVMRTEYVYNRPPPWSHTMPTIYVITPTYSRPQQKADLTRMANTLLHVPNLHWMVVEDSKEKTSMVSNFLKKTGLNYTHLNVETPTALKRSPSNPSPHRGTLQRNLPLKLLRETFSVNSSHSGVVYFGDDDNSYSLELFEEMRSTKIVSVWPVAFAGGLRYESCKVNTLGKVSGWRVKYAPNRVFAIDMAGFAVNLKVILSKSKADFHPHAEGGRQETRFLEQLTSLDELEPKAANCTKILVWHTRTERPYLAGEGKDGFTDRNVEVIENCRSALSKEMDDSYAVICCLCLKGSPKEVM